MWLRLAKKLGFSVTVAKFYLRLGLCFMFCHDVNSANSPGKICWKYIYIYFVFIFSNSLLGCGNVALQFRLYSVN